MGETPYLDKLLALALDEQPDLHAGDSPEDEDSGDWDEGSWDEVRSHLEQASSWFRRVMAGESPGDPDQIPQGWLDRGRELASGELSHVLLTPRTAEASTVHQPTVPPGGPGLFHIKGRQLPPYVQHLYKHLVAKYGKHRAYGVAIGIVKKWAKGVNPGGKGKGHKVHADVQAAAGKNIAEWEKDKTDAHIRHGAKKVAASNVALAVVRSYEREDLQGRWERVNSYIKNDDIRPGFIGPDDAMAHGELTGLWKANKEHSAQLRQHLKDAREHFAAGRHDAAGESLARAQDVARQHAYSFTVNALERQRQFVAARATAEQNARQEAARAAAAVPRKGGFLSKFHHHAASPLAASRTGPPSGQVSLAAPASWPSGRPYKSSFLPPGPTTSLLQGQPARTGVVTNPPGSSVGRLRQAPSQTVSAAPPLPPGVTLPTPGELDAIAAAVPNVDDVSLSESVRKFLRTAAEKMRTDDRQGALFSLRSAQAATHAAYRAAVRENMPVTAQVYGSITAVPPAEQSSATTAMLTGRAQTEKFRALNHQIATQIDRFRRDFFHGQVNQTPAARLTALAEALVDLAQVHPYKREDRFGRIVNVTGYIREGKPYVGKLVGDEADEAIHAGVAKGEYGEPTGYFQTSDGKKMWGWYGAAGLLVRHTDPQTGQKRYLLQKRAPWVDSGNTYSVPGGAMDHRNGVPETPVEAAHREAREELGRELPKGTTHAETRTKTFGEGKGAWSYHTVVMDTPHMFDPEGEGGLEGVHDTRNESRGYVWASPEEMAHLPLHPHFRATAEELGMPSSDPEQPQLSAGEIAEGLVELAFGIKTRAANRTLADISPELLKGVSAKQRRALARQMGEYDPEGMTGTQQRAEEAAREGRVRAYQRRGPHGQLEEVGPSQRHADPARIAVLEREAGIIPGAGKSLDERISQAVQGAAEVKARADQHALIPELSDNALRALHRAQEMKIMGGDDDGRDAVDLLDAYRAELDRRGVPDWRHAPRASLSRVLEAASADHG